uniref:Uncharacterized protein n=1 Tax=Anopheles coluzzii TaxID=1518534 RepID=A0A8W7P933_ANOCL
MNSTIRYGSRNAPPPCFSAVYGNFQMLPNPTEYAMQDSINSMSRPHLSRVEAVVFVSSLIVCSLGSWGNRSRTAVTIVVTMPVLLPSPSRKNIRKNSTANTFWAASNLAIASGYVMKVSWGPCSCISSTRLPVMCAMLPTIPNTTMPDTIEVKVSSQEMIIASLWGKETDMLGLAVVLY